MLLLGFGNRARNGKDSAAEAIRDFYSQQNQARLAHVPTWKGSVRVGIFKYATALYQEVNKAIEAGIWGTRQVFITRPGRGLVVLPEWVEPDPNPEVSALAPYGKHPKLLQWWGSEFRRTQDPDYWVRKLFASIPNNLDVVMITDVRFPNEAEAITQRDGYTVNVQRLREDGSQYYSDDRPSDHPSETALDNYNWNFYLKIPNGHQALLAEQAVTLAEYLRGLEKK